MVEERHETLAVTRGVVQPARLSIDRGAMVSVWLDGEIGHCATADLGAHGLQAAAGRALQWARAARGRGLGLADAPWPQPGTPACQAPADDPLPGRAELIGLLQAEAAAMSTDARVRHWSASLRATETRQRLWIDGALAAEQAFRFVEPNLEATAVDDARSQTRTLGGQYNGFCRQGGASALRDSGIVGGGARIADEALQLLGAANCPDGRRDLLLSPDQMMLQIHESIGHPLELDRILGDERNFAGTSFVVPEMFGRYRYGSPLLNVSFDPGVPGEFASYAADDDGAVAQPRRLIEGGILLRALGGTLSQARARALGWPIEGVACSRASGWQRAPIDRMANLNLEPGDATLEAMIASVERGIWMQTNASWSIDDSRNKFQFGCEWARLIENGRLGALVRNPNYRGISATFWRSLAAVGDRSTVQVLGTPYCGKGEPGQLVRVGHASPACLFRAVEVFGGEV